MATPPEHAPAARRSVRSLLWKGGLGLLLFVLTAAITNCFLPPDKKLAGGLMGNDLMPSYAAGTLVRDGRHAELYDPHAVTREVRRIWAHWCPDVPPGDGLAPWLNPPFFALVFVPLAGLPYGWALLAWAVTNAALTVCAWAMLVRLLPRGSTWSAKGLIPLLTVASFPFVQATCHQQNTFLSLAILSTTLALTMRCVQTRNGSDRRLPSSARKGLAFCAGAVAGLLLFKPQLGVVVTCAIAIVLGWRAVAGAAFTGTALLVISELALPGATAAFVQQMPEAVRLVQERSGYGWQRQATLFGFWRLLFMGQAGGPATLLVKAAWAASAAGVVAMLAWAAVRAWRATRENDATGEGPGDATGAARRWLAAAVCATPLVMPYYMDYDLLLLSAAATLLAADVLAAGRVTTADRLLTGAWAFTGGWMIFEPGIVTNARVNVTVVLLTTIAAMMIARVRLTRTAAGDAVPAQAGPIKVRRAA